jgi:hypothetical protein
MLNVYSGGLGEEGMLGEGTRWVVAMGGSEGVEEPTNFLWHLLGALMA